MYLKNFFLISRIFEIVGSDASLGDIIDHQNILNCLRNQGKGKIEGKREKP